MERTTRDRVIIFDFDGTITVGDGPVRAYAEQVAARIVPRLAQDFRDAVEDGLRNPDAEHSHGAIDDYDLVRRAALAHGADSSVLSAAYLASRELLATEQAVISAPFLSQGSGHDLASWLHRLKTLAYLVLATNAPSTGLDRALAVLGVTDAFDEVRTSVGKPAGMETLVEEMLLRGPVLSVGDVWLNDLEPVRVRGGTTAFLTRGGVGDARATLCADTLDGLAPGITAWATATDAPVAPHDHPAPTTTTAKADL
ncbi:HAD family hydrolase [Sanguibacter sp. 25GB23B1]|uniref:HAD family hydrolase n=1 Tax=unclassified Sanguibacter TaxID=2645534 RepID=UPI0032AFACC3